MRNVIASGAKQSLNLLEQSILILFTELTIKAI